MKLNFIKMEGLGNDYIYIDCFKQQVKEPEKLTLRLADRHFGIGGDGIILISPSDKADANMRMFNADGSEGKMCGNAIRCVGKYLYDNGYVKSDKITIDTKSGIKELMLKINSGKVDMVCVNMGKADLSCRSIPVVFHKEQMINEPLKVGSATYNVTCVSMGNPHCVVFCKDTKKIRLDDIGPLFERHSIFPDRVNTEFVQVISDRELNMRVWERGTGETMACGTGTCATVVAAVINGHCLRGEDITVHLRGGDLIINFAADGSVFMTGPARLIYEGVVEI